MTINLYKLCDSSKIDYSLGFDLKKFSIDKDLKRLKKRNEYKLNGEDILIQLLAELFQLKIINCLMM